MTSTELKHGTHKAASTLTFDLHPLYASILRDGATVREGEVLGLDGDLRRVLIAPFSGIARLLITGQGNDRRVKVYLTEGSVTSRRSAPLSLRDTINHLENSRN
ncbi:MAG: hypothetical protein H8F28_15465 [Fibrella sp.]|nr:hypothetical protein [Armatimonadota bacterium]